jgi:hypothetical protein
VLFRQGFFVAIQSAVVKKYILSFLLFVFLLVAGSLPVRAQCSICTRTVQQLGERPARALNRGIIYLAFTPLALFGIIGYRWWKSEQHHE